MEDESPANASSQRSTLAFDRVASAMAWAMKAPMIAFGIRGLNSPLEKRDRERESLRTRERRYFFLPFHKACLYIYSHSWWLQQKTNFLTEILTYWFILLYSLFLLEYSSALLRTFMSSWPVYYVVFQMHGCATMPFGPCCLHPYSVIRIIISSL